MLLRIGNVALVVTFNDACGAINGTMPRLERIEGPLSEIQAREVMVDFAFVNLHIKERPKFYTECIMEKEKVTEKAIMPDQFELGELNYSVRGRLMRHCGRSERAPLRSKRRSTADTLRFYSTRMASSSRRAWVGCRITASILINDSAQVFRTSRVPGSWVLRPSRRLRHRMDRRKAWRTNDLKPPNATEGGIKPDDFPDRRLIELSGPCHDGGWPRHHHG